MKSGLRGLKGRKERGGWGLRKRGGEEKNKLELVIIVSLLCCLLAPGLDVKLFLLLIISNFNIGHCLNNIKFIHPFFNIILDMWE